MWSAASGGSGGGGPWWDMGYTYWGLAMHAGWPLLVAAVAVAVMVLLLRRRGAPADPETIAVRAAPDALTVLNTRYARGEIDRDEYLQRKRDLAWRSGNA